MRILIVDDNIAIQEIVGEILLAEGHDIVKTGTYEGAAELIESFNPEAIFLDSQVEGHDGVKLLDRLSPDTTVKVVLISKNRNIKVDSQIIIRTLYKPFKSSDVIDAVREIEEIENKPLKDKLFKLKLFSKSIPQDVAASIEEDPNIKFGKSYVVFEDDPQIIYSIGINLAKTCNLMVITTGKVKTITDRFHDYEIKVLGLSAKARFGYVEMSRLGTLMNSLTEFIDGNARPVIVFDDIEQMISINGINTVVSMIHQIINAKTLTLAISLDGDSINEKEKEMILGYMEEYRIKKE